MKRLLLAIVILAGLTVSSQAGFYSGQPGLPSGSSVSGSDLTLPGALNSRTPPKSALIFDNTTGFTTIGAGVSSTVSQGPTVKLTIPDGVNAEFEANPSCLLSSTGAFALRFYVDDWTKIADTRPIRVVFQS